MLERRSIRRVVALVIALMLAPVALRGQDAADAQNSPASPQNDDAAQGEQPRDLGLKEQAASRLVQLDVSVIGSPEAVEGLTADDFEVVVGSRHIADFLVDRVCRDVRVDTTTVADTSSQDAPTLSTLAPPITYVFFFDQTHLTIEGYHRSFEMVGELIEGLFEANVQAMILSSARDLRVVTDLTSDKSALLAGLKELKQDRSQFDTFAMEEDRRVWEVIRARSDFARQAMARVQQEVEMWAVSRSLHRVSIALGRISEVDPPKAFFYFADTMRRRAGEHYEVVAGGTDLETYAFMALDSFDKVINEASAVGVRFYSIEAQGMTGLSLGGNSASKTRRVRDSQNTLATMALETGGRSFLNGVPGKKIIAQVQTDLHCMYLISFSPEGFPLDKQLPVRVQTRRPGATARTRGRIVIQSESSNRQTRLIAAFATGHSEGTEGAIEGRIVPTGFIGGKYVALVQVMVPGSMIPSTTWDIGVSVVTRGKVRDDASGRIARVAPGTPLVYEHVMEFPPGPFEMAVVAHETTTDQVLSTRIQGDWPDPDDEDVTLIPAVMMQPVQATFLRDERLKPSSALSFGADPALHGDRPIAILGLVCRSKSNKKALTVERSLVGESTVRFDPLQLADPQDRCALYRDVVPGGTLGAGGFRHEVHVADGKKEKAAQTADFQVVPPQSR